MHEETENKYKIRGCLSFYLFASRILCVPVSTTWRSL